jgi:hypothetical protein
LARLAPAYAPRRPEQTALHGIVREHLASFLAYANQHHEGGLPKYVEHESRAYLKCGIFAYGFARAHCGIVFWFISRGCLTVNVERTAAALSTMVSASDVEREPVQPSVIREPTPEERRGHRAASSIPKRCGSE